MNVVDALAAFLVDRPTAVTTLLAQHRGNGRGRCRCCGAGAQQGFPVWPCTIHAAATQAAVARAEVRP